MNFDFRYVKIRTGLSEILVYKVFGDVVWRFALLAAAIRLGAASLQRIFRDLPSIYMDEFSK